MIVTSSVDFQQPVTGVQYRAWSATAALTDYIAAGIVQTPGTFLYWLQNATVPAGTIQIEWSCSDPELTCFDTDLIVTPPAPVAPTAPLPVSSFSFPVSPSTGNDFEDFMAEGFAEAMNIFNPPSSSGKRKVELTFAGKTKPCIATAFMRSRKLQEAGYQPEIPSVVELSRPDFASLSLRDRSEVAVAGQKFTVMLIEDDPHDIAVRLHLEFLS